MYCEPQLYSDLPAARRAIVNARIEREKKKLAKLPRDELRALLVTHALAESIDEVGQLGWRKAEMVFELASLIVELNPGTPPAMAGSKGRGGNG